MNRQRVDELVRDQRAVERRREGIRAGDEAIGGVAEHGPLSGAGFLACLDQMQAQTIVERGVVPPRRSKNVG
jgi:hypothetical protein